MRTMTYESTRTIDSKTIPGVRFTIHRMSFGRRLELAQRVREAGRSLEFKQAGSSVADSVEAAITSAELERICLDWGLRAVEGLMIDGEPADPKMLVDRGPEELTREIISEIRMESGLSPDERKN